GKRMIVIADETKLKDKLGAFPLPVEVIQFGHVTTAARIAAVAELLDYGDMAPKLRMRDSKPFVTDSGNYIYDCPFASIHDTAALASLLSTTPGVVEHGLFVGFASVLIIAGAEGIQVIEHPTHSFTSRSDQD